MYGITSGEWQNGDPNPRQKCFKEKRKPKRNQQVSRKGYIECMKTCNTCKQNKPETSYSRRASSKDGLSLYCKECVREKSLNASDENKQKQVERRRASKQSPRARRKRQLENNLRDSLRAGSNHFSSHTGCTGKELRAHVESKFRFGMSWGNWGKLWQIDHIEPSSSWPLENMAESNHYTNIQPLLIADNHEKATSAGNQQCLVCQLHYSPRQLSEYSLCRNCLGVSR
jgi:hypothetical protein